MTISIDPQMSIICKILWSCQIPNWTFVTQIYSLPSQDIFSVRQENQSLQQKLSCNLLFKYMHQTHTHTCRTVINQYKIQCGTSQFINIILYHYKPIIDRTFNLLARRPQWRSQGYTHIIHQLWPGSRNIKLAGSFKTLSYQGIATYTLTSRKQPFKSMEICFLQGPTNQNPPRRHP